MLAWTLFVVVEVIIGIWYVIEHIPTKDSWPLQPPAARGG